MTSNSTGRSQQSAIMQQPESEDASRKLPRTVWLLSWVSFFADVSSEMVYPLLPLFLVGVIGTSKTQLGAMEGIAVLLVALMSAFAGQQSDRSTSAYRRTRWIRWGYGLPVLGRAMIAIASSWSMVMTGRMFDRLGKGLRGAPRDALISDVVTESMRGRAYGLHRAFDTAGALLGVLIAALLVWYLTGQPEPNITGEASERARETPAWVYRTIIAIGAILGLASWGLTFWVSEPSANDKKTDAAHSNAEVCIPESEPSSSPRSVWAVLPRSYWRTIIILMLFSLANSSDAFLLLRVRDLGYSPVAVILVYALFNVTYAIFSYPAGAISDRIGRWWMMGLGWLVYAIVYAVLAMLSTSSAWLLWPTVAFYGLYMALTDGVGKALIADHAPRAYRGTAMGIYHALTGLTTLFASLLAGLAWDYSGPTTALLLAMGFATISLIVLIFVQVTHQHRTDN